MDGSGTPLVVPGMRWSIIRLIWLRELRDQLRDRRTVFMVAVLPVLLYPIAGFGVLQLAQGYLGQRSVVGIAGLDNLLPWRPLPVTIPRAISFFSCTPAPPGCPIGGPARLAGAVAQASLPAGDVGPGEPVAVLAFTPPPPGCPGAGISRAALVASLVLAQPSRTWPALVEEQDGQPVFAARYQGSTTGNLALRRLEVPLGDPADGDTFLAGIDRGPLERRRVDLMLVIPPGFQERLAATGQVEVFLLARERDESARLVELRVRSVLNRWKNELKQVRLARHDLPIDFDEPLVVRDPRREQHHGPREDGNLFSALARVFPFILVLWSLAGALYPAVDLCAGEKERGTMETLLISPAGREEIVWGKFLTIWVFSAATALLNLLSMALTTWRFASAVPGSGFSPGALFWGVLLLLPLSAFFSAICLAVGAYARSSKEGQYYLMPLFMLTMPLIFLTLAPGVELNPFYSMVPVTGVALLLQRLMSTEPVGRGVWLYFIPVLAPMVIYSWLALRWAIAQFQREEVLFREAERLDIGLWLRRLLRDKEAMPSVGEALFCFGLILALRWLSLGVGAQLSLLTRTGVAQLAFVATPPLFMALLLTTRPLRGLGLRLPPWWAWPAAVVLALLVLPPLALLTLTILRQFPGLAALLELNHPLTRELRALGERGGVLHRQEYLVVLCLLPALCEELAFRGFILTGLLRAFRARTAILLSAFLFAVYQMNVFQFAPHFLLGVVLGLLVVRSGSVLPAMLFHLVYNTTLMTAPALFGEDRPERLLVAEVPTWLVVALAGVCAVLAGAGMWAVWYLGRPGRAEEVVP